MPSIVAKLQSTLERNAHNLDACLAAHAAVHNRIAIPRAYWISGDDTSHVNNVSILLSDDSCCALTTKNILKQIGVPFKEIASAQPPETAAIACEIETLLYDSFGEGIVRYDMARYTPFTLEDLSLVPQNTSFVRAQLEQRLECKFGYLNTYKRLCTPVLRSGALSIFESILKSKVDEDWQRRWRSHTCYVDISVEERILDALLFST